MEEELRVEVKADIEDIKEKFETLNKRLESLEKESKKKMKGFQEAMKKAGDTSTKALKAVGVAMAGAATALVGLVAATKDYRNNQAKLVSAFQTAGASANEAKQVYNDLYRVLGEDDRAVEAANHLAKLTTSQADLSEWTKICQGVYATFGDSLPIESLTEAANETAKTGELTGALADALNWAGVNEDTFAKQLEKCNSEAEREQLIRSTLNGLYSEAAANYETNNAAILRQNEAQARLNESLGKVGEALQPVMTALSELGADILEDLMPYIEEFTEKHLPSIIEKLDGVGEKIGKVFTWIAEHWEFLTTLGAILLSIAAAIKVISTVMAVVNAVMAMSPITWIILAIVAAVAALTAAIIWCVKNFEKIKKVAGIVWNAIKNFFGGAGEWFSGIFQKAVNGIKNAFSTITGFFSNVWNNIKSIFSNVGNSIATGIKGAVSKAVNAVLSTATKIINGFIKGINFAIGVINAIPGVNIGKIKELSAPQMARGGIVDAATLAIIGEQGREAVVPLENNLGWMDKMAGMLVDRMGGSGNSKQPAVIYLQVNGRTLGEVVVDNINDITKHKGSIPLIFA